MNVEIAVVAFPVRGVDAHIHGHAVAVGDGLAHARCQLAPVGVAQLVRQGRPPLAGHSRILALLGGLGGIPQGGALGNRNACGRDDLGRQDAAFPGEVEHFPGALIYQLRRGSIGGSSHGAMPGRPSYRVRVQMVDRHFFPWRFSR